ncbi:MAG: hypothetical protein ACK58Y_20175 [Microcystis sp.]
MALFRSSPRLFSLFTFFLSLCGAVSFFFQGKPRRQQNPVAIANPLLVRHYEREFQRLYSRAVLGIKS